MKNNNHNYGQMIFILGVVLMVMTSNGTLGVIIMCVGIIILNQKQDESTEEKLIKLSNEESESKQQLKLDLNELMGHPEFNSEISNKNRSKAIKVCQELTNCSVPEAQEAVDQIMKKYL